jgi:putative salt-induced outer membrane protein YdiY
MLHSKFLIAGAALLCAASLSFTMPAQAEDKVFLENGDQFSGEIISYDQNQLVIKTAYGQFDVPLRYIKGAYTDNQAEGIEIAQSLAALDAPAPLASPLAAQDIASVSAMPPVNAELAQSEMAMKQEGVQPKPKTPVDSGAGSFWGADFSGNVNIGFDMKRGNSETEEFNLDGTLKSTVKKHDFKLRGEYNREKEGENLSADDRSLALDHDYNFTDKWFIGSRVKLEQDEITRLDIRSTASSGLGYHWIQRDDLSVKFVAGPGYIYEEFEDGAEDGAFTYNWSFDYNQKFYDDLFRLFHEHSLVSPAEDVDAYLFESRSGLRVPIRKGIVASAQVDYDWDNAPAQNSKEDDTTYSLKLGYEWP